MPAGLHTIVLAVSLFAVLELEGKGKWATAIRSFFEHPAKLIFIAILLVSFLFRRWDGFNVSMVLDCVFGIGVFWAFEAIGSSFL